MKGVIIMRKRSENKSFGGAKPKYSTKGAMYFEITGYVQKVKEYPKGKCDYITFKIEDRDIRKDYYQDVSVKIPHSLDVLVLEGDHIWVSGTITSFWLEDASRMLLELVAEEVEDADQGALPSKSAPSDEEPI